MNDPGVLYGMLTFVAIVIVYVWVGLSLSAVFAKAGEAAWQAWVPILNTVVLLRLGGMSGWLVLLLLVPGLGQIALAIVLIVAYHRINVAFGMGAGMTVLAALLFPVWTSVLGWGPATWVGSEVAGPRRRGPEAGALDARMSPADDHGVPPRPPMPGYATPAAPSAASLPAAPAPAASPAQAAPTPRPVAPSRAAASDPLFMPVAPRTPEPPAAWLSSEPAAAPAFRSSARRGEPSLEPVAEPADAADVADDESSIVLGRSHAPFTQTVPTLGDTPEPASPAAPRRAFAPRPGEAPEPIGSFAPVVAPRAAAPAAPSDAEAEPAPVQSVPAAPAAAPAGDPWAPPTQAPAVTTPAVARPAPWPEPEHGFETSAEVSAVAGAPSLGAPRSARESVAAQHGEREIPETEGAFDETILAERRRPTWMLSPPLGAPVPVTSDVLIIGRRPGSDTAFPDAQLVRISDETRTMSKTHARLELRGDAWVIVDLDSTNGVVLLGDDGSEKEATPGLAERLTTHFLLGDAELSISTKDDPARAARSSTP